MALLELENVTKVYLLGSQRLEVLKRVSLAINEGEFVAIMGPSGSGKSTLMHIVGCLDVPTEGRYRLDGREVSRLRGSELARLRLMSVGFIFQSFNLLPRLTALQNVALPLMYSGARDRVHRASGALERVGLGGRLGHKPTELSGGEMQRVAIARALVNEPKVILADEPTGNLDSRSGVEILKLFHELHEQGRTIVMVTHDEHLARSAQRLVTIHDGILSHAAAPA